MLHPMWRSLNLLKNRASTYVLSSMYLPCYAAFSLLLLQPRRSQSRRAWNDHASWFRNLFKLECLEQLALRTSAPFARPASTAAMERKTLMKWVSRVTHGRRPENCAHDHPTLSFIRVWYHSTDPGHGVIMGWSKSTGIWENIIRTIRPSSHANF